VNDGSEELDRATRRQMRKSPADEHDSLAELHERLRTLTPYPVGTVAIIAANIVVFGAMVASGVHLVTPTSQSLVEWGADYGPKISAGQWWRLFTSMFLHVGLMHIAMNMWALWMVGRFIERALGTTSYLVVYLLSGWAGSVVSALTKPMAVSAGASGAIFGVFGVMLAFVLRPRQTVPMAALRPLRGSTFSFLAINLVLGISAPAIDLAAHLGGLASGFVLGALFGHELSFEARRAARGRTLLLGTATMVVLGVATLTLKERRLPDVLAMLTQFAPVETRVVAVYDEAREKVLRGEMSDDEFADVIERDVLGPWRALRIDPATVRYVPRDLRELVRDLENHREEREDEWELIVEKLRSGDALEVDMDANGVK
jgi:rhomboid protease GluP